MGARKPIPWMRFQIAHARRTPHRWVVGVAGLLASVAIHVVLIQAVIWGARGAPQPVHQREGFGANAFGAADEAVTTLFFVEDADASPSQDKPMEDLASAGKVLQSLHVTILSPDPSVNSALRNPDTGEIASTSEDESAGEREARAALFGRYIGQIEARIERAWTRPRTAIGADLFDCRVQVQQSARGAVLEVTLKECNGDSRWQLSLVNAIQGASPLPAPPDPGVFASSIELSFSSVAFAPDRTEQGFEPSTVAAFNNNTTRSP